ncbi:MAG: hypothetical protein K5656_11165 [Lachnospiraceae bacterium]|nr:hypothetical protein [Lachnospiraceae bacterium]
MFNPNTMFQMQRMWQTFTDEHPKFPAFLQAVSATKLNPGSIIEFNITTAEGQNIASNIKLTENDVKMIEELEEIIKSAR